MQQKRAPLQPQGKEMAFVLWKGEGGRGTEGWHSSQHCQPHPLPTHRAQRMVCGGRGTARSPPAGPRTLREGHSSEYLLGLPEASSFHPAKTLVPRCRRAQPAPRLLHGTKPSVTGTETEASWPGWGWGPGGCVNQTAPAPGSHRSGAAMFLEQEYGIAI